MPPIRTWAGCAALAWLVAAGCAPPKIEIPPPEPPTVTVASPVQLEIQPYAEFIGRTAAINEVDVVPEITGIIKSIGYIEGTTVKAGDVLYQIDPIPFQAALDRAKADLDNYEAQLKNAKRDLDRLNSITGSTAKEKDETISRREVADAQIKSSKAMIAKAEFDLSRTKIVAPIDGGINRTEKTVGNLVIANQTKLTRIVSISPIFAYWDVDENTSLKYRDMIYKDKTIGDPRDAKSRLKCWMRLKNEDKWVRTGEVDYAARDVTRLTASRELRGVFPNADGYITPGDSCRIRVEAGPKRQAILIPEIAVGSQQSQKIVYVLVPGEKPEETKVMPRAVVLGEVREGLQVVESGLKPDEKIVVNGLLRVRPGLAVKAVVEPIQVPKAFQ